MGDVQIITLFYSVNEGHHDKYPLTISGLRSNPFKMDVLILDQHVHEPIIILSPPISTCKQQHYCTACAFSISSPHIRIPCQ
jgi:hypothetical protein